MALRTATQADCIPWYRVRETSTTNQPLALISQYPLEKTTVWCFLGYMYSSEKTAPVPSVGPVHAWYNQRYTFSLVSPTYTGKRKRNLWRDASVAKRKSVNALLRELMAAHLPWEVQSTNRRMSLKNIAKQFVKLFSNFATVFFVVRSSMVATSRTHWSVPLRPVEFAPRVLDHFNVSPASLTG